MANIYDGAFRAILDLSGDVINEIAQQYENVQKGAGDMMRGALIETSARTILNQGIKEGISETKKNTALKLLKRGKQTVEEIVEDTGHQRCGSGAACRITVLLCHRIHPFHRIQVGKKLHICDGA